MSTGGAIFIGLVAAMFPALILVAFVVKLWEVRAARRWLATAGRVVVSTVASKRKKPGDPGYNFGDTEVSNVPRVEYEYTVAGRKLRGQRITIGEKIGGTELEGVLARYPVGADVTVYYDPARPEKAVLERDLPAGIYAGLGCVLLFFIGGPLLAALFYFNGLAWLTTHIAQPQHAPFVAAAALFGLLACGFGLAFARVVWQALHWPTTPGRITASGVDAYRQWRHRSRPTDRLHYKSCVVYSYEVNGREYAGDRVTIGVTVSASFPGFARRAAAKYPVGTAVQVHYNPENPGESVLHPYSHMHLLIPAIVAGMFALAWAVATGRI